MKYKDLFEAALEQQSKNSFGLGDLLYPQTPVTKTAAQILQETADKEKKLRETYRSRRVDQHKNEIVSLVKKLLIEFEPMQLLLQSPNFYALEDIIKKIEAPVMEEDMSNTKRTDDYLFRMLRGSFK